MCKTENVRIAKVIREQIGRQAFVMIGARDLTAVENGLSFRVQCRGSKANCVTVTLDWTDTYHVKCEMVRRQRGGIGFTRKVTLDREGVHCDQLRDMIEIGTGLYCSLGGA